MNHHEAKFLLRARRPGGKDCKDPVFAEALAQAEKDPMLKAWLDNEAAFDRTVAARLQEIQPPAGLRDAILAGCRVSQRPTNRWKKPLWLALAASIAITLTLTLRLRPAGPSAREFAEFALNDLATAGGMHDGKRPDLGNLQAELATAALPLSANANVSGENLRRAGCRVMKFAGHDVFEICFQRDGSWYHLYAVRIEDLARGPFDPRSLLTSKGQFTSTAWKDARFAYALVTGDGSDALHRLIYTNRL